MVSREEKIKDWLRSAGFDRVGITSAEPLRQEGEYLERWIAAGHAGGMDYLKKNSAWRSDPGKFLGDARSVIVAAAHYAPPVEARGPIAGYALYRDYHEVFRQALEPAASALHELDSAARCRIAVDSSPLLECALAARAGLGWIGRSTNLITPDFGPHVMLGLIVTTLELVPDSPTENQACRECGQCAAACPTQALVAPYELDARKCISYLTIEKKGPFSLEEAKALGGWAFGCDLCMAACSARLDPGKGGRSEGLLRPGAPSLWGLDLEALLDLCEGGFKKVFRDTPLFRTGRSRLIRNILTAASNLDLPWVAARAVRHLEGGTEASREAARRSMERRPG
jgi:epoxyqueuosine reductase